MNFLINKQNCIPINVQIKEQIIMLINSGVYREGEKLPSIIQIATNLKVNKNTIVSVIKDLEREGYVETLRGKGIFIKRTLPKNPLDSDFLNMVDALLLEADNRDINYNHLINLISIRYVDFKLNFSKLQNEDERAPKPVLYE